MPRAKKTEEKELKKSTKKETVKKIVAKPEPKKTAVKVEKKAPAKKVEKKTKVAKAEVKVEELKAPVIEEKVVEEKKAPVKAKKANAQAGKDTGSVEAQIDVFSKKIKSLTSHLKEHIHDFDSKRGLLIMVGKRRRLLNYLKKNEPLKYEKLVKNLKLKK